jgi:hypothetical protein
MKLIVLAILFLGSCTSFANQMSARLELNNNELKEVLLGEVLDFRLIMWPVDNEIEAIISESLFRSDFIEGFYIVQVQELARADTNYEAIVVRLNGIFTTVRDTYLLQLNDTVSLIQMDSFRVTGENETPSPIFLMVDRDRVDWTRVLIISFLRC